MTAQRGKDLLLKIEDIESPGIFSTVAGMRTKTLSLNAQTIDVTHSESTGGWRELLAGAGVRQASIAGAGVFLNDTASEMVRRVFFDGSARNWQVIVPGFGTIEGVFVVANLDYAGDHGGEATVSLALASAGEIRFTGGAS